MLWEGRRKEGNERNKNENLTNKNKIIVFRRRFVSPLLDRFKSNQRFCYEKSPSGSGSGNSSRNGSPAFGDASSSSPSTSSNNKDNKIVVQNLQQASTPSSSSSTSSSVKIVTKISSISPDGGTVDAIDAAVVRVYPIQVF